MSAIHPPRVSFLGQSEWWWVNPDTSLMQVMRLEAALQRRRWLQLLAERMGL